MRRTLVLALLSSLFVLGCISGGDDLFLTRKLDDDDKARALTEQGIQQYTVHLVRRADYEKLAEVREFFVVALRYDPENARAAQYLDLVDDFKNVKVREKVKEANRYLAKPKRKEDEDFALLVALQTAARLDPQNKDVGRMMRDTTQVRVSLAEVYVSRSRAAVAKIDTGTPPVTREAVYIEAFQNAGKAVAIDPQNGQAGSQKDSLRGELAKIFARRDEAAHTLIGNKKFDEARAEVAALLELNKKLDGAFDGEVKASSYSLNYQWASALFSQKEYARASARIDAALAITRTAEAAALKRKIVEIRAQTEKEVSFDAGLQQIDKLIAKQDIVGAKRRVEALARVTRDQDKLDTLDDRRDKLRSFLKDIYDRGVSAYRDEKFKDAVESLQVVVQVDVNYEQASDYLDKAKAKQKLLDQF